MEKFNLVNEKIIPGEKITIVSSTEFGFMYALQTTYRGCRPAPHYLNCPESMIGVRIENTPKGKRNPRLLTIPYETPLVIYKEWKNIDVDSIIYETTPSENPHILSIKKSKYTSFDDRNFLDLLAKYGEGVIVKR